MRLVTKEAMFITKVFIKLRDNADLLKEHGIVICENCRGTGLTGIRLLDDESGMSWNGEFCDECKGIGYVLIEDVKETLHDLFGEFICSHCHGMGCKRCHNKGFVDWIDHACGG